MIMYCSTVKNRSDARIHNWIISGSDLELAYQLPSIYPSVKDAIKDGWKVCTSRAHMLKVFSKKFPAGEHIQMFEWKL